MTTLDDTLLPHEREVLEAHAIFALEHRSPTELVTEEDDYSDMLRKGYEAETRAYLLFKEHCTPEQRNQLAREVEPGRLVQASITLISPDGGFAGELTLHRGGAYWSAHCVYAYRQRHHMWTVGDVALAILLAVRMTSTHTEAYHHLCHYGYPYTTTDLADPF